MNSNKNLNQSLDKDNPLTFFQTGKALIKENKKEIRFIIFFILFFFVGQSLSYALRLYASPFILHKLNAEVGSKLINLIIPDEKTLVSGNVIHSGRLRMTIEKGCEGTEGIILIVAAIFAFPMRFLKKMVGLLLGTLIIYIANLIRIIALFASLKYKPALFDVMHIYIGQTFIIFIGSVFFIFWINRSMHDS